MGNFDEAVKGYVRIPSPPFEACPKCGEMNTPTVFRVFRVADERGLHGECEVCAHAWPMKSEP